MRKDKTKKEKKEKIIKTNGKKLWCQVYGILKWGKVVIVRKRAKRHSKRNDKRQNKKR